MSRPYFQQWLRHPAAVLLAALFVAGPGTAQQVEIDGSQRPNSPIGDPLAAWRQALVSLPPGVRVRRLAFAEAILFVFYSAAGDDAISALTLTPTPNGYFPEDSGERDASLCSADGVDPARVEHGLRGVLASPDWQRHAGKLDSLILECMGPELRWTLMPVPEGGYKEGVPIETLSLPFVAGPESDLPSLERN